MTAPSRDDAKQRVSDEQVAMAIRLHNDFYCAGPETDEGVYIGDLALDLRDARAEIVRLNGQTHFDASAEEAARWRECAQACASVLREWVTLDEDNFMVSGLSERTRAVVARFDAMNLRGDAMEKIPVDGGDAGGTV